MKNIMSILLLLMILSLCLGCSSARDKAAIEVCDVNMEMAMEDGAYSMDRSTASGDMKSDAEPGERAAEEPEALICVTFSQYSSQTVNDAGEKLFVCQCNEPQIVTEDEEINTWLASVVDKIKQRTVSDLERVEQQAWRDRENREEEGVPFYTYSYYTNVTTERMDNTVISALQVNNVYSGGAHPGYVQIGHNFDLENKTQLTLADVIIPGSEEKLQQGILSQLEQRFGGLEHSGLYADYPQIVKASFEVPGLTPNWYFGSFGLVIYYNCYDIAPYTAGIIKVEFPYDTLDGILRPEYYPAVIPSGDGSVALLASSEGRDILNEQPEGPCYYIGPDLSSVYDVKISQLSGWITDDVPIQGPMVFAANRLTAADAVALLDSSGAGYLLTFRNRAGELQVLAINSSEIREIVAKTAE